VRDARQLLSEVDARVLLGLPKGGAVPDESTLSADAEAIVTQNLALAREVEHLGEQGLLLSPVWESNAGVAQARMAVRPPSFRTRYFEPEGLEVLRDSEAIDAVVDVVPWMMDDPVGAAVALDDTLRAWRDDTAPVRSLGVAMKPHTRLLSLLLADVARKGAAGLDTLEWLASLGVPIAELRDDGDPSEDEIRASMKANLRAMWDDERGWMRAAFTRRS